MNKQDLQSKIEKIDNCMTGLSILQKTTTENFYKDALNLSLGFLNEYKVMLIQLDQAKNQKK